jgi:hypothetical protein
LYCITFAAESAAYHKTADMLVNRFFYEIAKNKMLAGFILQMIFPFYFLSKTGKADILKNTVYRTTMGGFIFLIQSIYNCVINVVIKIIDLNNLYCL